MSGKLTLDYVKISPMAQSGGWGVVTGSVYQMSLAIAASLAVLFFVPLESYTFTKKLLGK